MAINTTGHSTPPEKSAVETRQGVISGRVILVLLASLLLVVVGLTVSYCAIH